MWRLLSGSVCGLAALCTLAFVPSCQTVVDRLIPGTEQGDGRSRLLHLGRDIKGGTGAPNTPATLLVQAHGGTHLAVRVDHGIARTLDANGPGESELCVALPAPSKDGWQRTQLLVESRLAAFDVLVGLVTFDTDGAGGAGASDELAHICPGSRLRDQEHLLITGPGPTPLEDGDGGTGGISEEGGATSAGTGGTAANPDMGGTSGAAPSGTGGVGP